MLASSRDAGLLMHLRQSSTNVSLVIQPKKTILVDDRQLFIGMAHTDLNALRKNDIRHSEAEGRRRARPQSNKVNAEWSPGCLLHCEYANGYGAPNVENDDICHVPHGMDTAPGTARELAYAGRGSIASFFTRFSL
ncbi:unnamed protein product [Dibothriocephalus latus]|uniref:Uncharacterized protein n=1 Tax=Dibothriocephalus latus TaxID=60516 RepID=A0A3P7KV45_DIBLA|nr:unnamed protein product [Dibothriocephalus latus]